jgi:hypothetical protein
MDHDVHAAVGSLLTAAGLNVSDEEFGALVRVYPELRAQADALNRSEFQGESPAPVFDPSRPWPRTPMAGSSE